MTDPVPFGDVLRENITYLLICRSCNRPRISRRQMASDIGLPLSTFSRFMAGGQMSLPNVDRIVAYINRNAA
jgi:hypothetical protein